MIILMLALLPFVVPLIFLSLNTLVVGETQQGKSTLVLTQDILPTIEARTHAVVIFDPHDTLVDRVLKYCATTGHWKRVIADDLGSTGFVASPGILQRVATADPRERRFLHRMKAMATLEAFAARRTEYNIHDRTNTLRYGLLALTAWYENERDLDAGFVPFALMPPRNLRHRDSPFDYILSGVRSYKIRYEMERFRELSPNRLDDLLGGARRLLDESFDDECFKYRLRPTFSLRDFLRAKGIWLVKGGRASDDSKRTMIRLLGQRVIDEVVDNWFDPRAPYQPLFVRRYDDESSSLRTLGLSEASVMGQSTKFGLTFCVICQSPDWGADEIRDRVFQNTPRKIVLKSSPPCSRVLADAMRANLSLYHEHYTEETTRQVHAGWEVIEKKGTGSWKSGDQKGSSESVGTHFLPIYQNVTDRRTRYVPLNSLDMMNEARIQQLTRGRCITVENGTVFTHAFDDWKDPGTFPGYSDSLVRKFTEHQLRAGVLQPPSDVDFDQWQSPISDDQAKTKASTKKARKGMR